MSIKIVAITACPTGIAHTYMAAASLKKAAQELSIHIDVETQGSDGAGSELTSEAINQADFVLFAADKHVEKKRFTGKKIIEVPVGEAVKNATALLKSIADGKYNNLSNYTSGEDTSDLFQTGNTHGVYKHLMAGVSEMLPFIVAGGIFIGISFAFGISSYKIGAADFNSISYFFNQWGGGTGAFALITAILGGFVAKSVGGVPAFMPGMVGGYLANTYRAGFLGAIIAGFVAGYVIIMLRKAFAKLPPAVASLRPVIFYPFFGLLITGMILWVVFTPIAALMDSTIAYLNSLNDSNRGFIGMLIGGMMATDMGGPINKTASLFANAALAEGNYSFQSAKMAGGMVPPIAIAFCTTIFPKLFSKAEREAGLSCYFMGACFITEGVIPFAASDPLRVITSSIVGSTIAGFLTQYFNIIQTATHGGIFVIPLTSSPLVYIGIIVFSSLVSALILGFWKKAALLKISPKI